jgi:uncharacterized cupin superfamily protein
MQIKNARSIAGVASPHGEIVHELFGSAAGGSQQHSLAQIVIPPGKSSLRHYHPVDEDLVLLAVCVPPWTPDNSVFLD